MRTVLMLISLLVTSVAFAQLGVRNNGVDFYTDEFTGDTMCSQIVIDTDNDIEFALVRYSNRPDTIFWVVAPPMTAEPPFVLDEFSDYEEMILIKLSDDIWDFHYFSVDNEPITATRLIQTVFIPVGMESMYDIISHDGLVRVRFDGANRNYDFTFPEEIRVLFASEFFIDCLSDSGESI